MADANLRELERRWLRTGADADADAYVVALRRAGAPACSIHRIEGRWGTPARFSVEEILARLDE